MICFLFFFKTMLITNNHLLLMADIDKRTDNVCTPEGKKGKDSERKWTL